MEQMGENDLNNNKDDVLQERGLVFDNLEYLNFWN